MPGDNIFIFIEINEVQKIVYYKEQIEWVKILLPGVQQIDFDNNSEGFIIDAAIEIIKNANKIFVSINSSNPSLEPGRITRFMNHLVRQKNKKVNVILNGESTVLEKMGKTLGNDSFYQNLSSEDQKKLIQQFFKD
jgi:archaellum component FlaG (FlaF/FlaG flagellin family)